MKGTRGGEYKCLLPACALEYFVSANAWDDAGSVIFAEIRTANMLEAISQVEALHHTMWKAHCWPEEARVLELHNLKSLKPSTTRLVAAPYAAVPGDGERRALQETFDRKCKFFRYRDWLLLSKAVIVDYAVYPREFGVCHDFPTRYFPPRFEGTVWDADSHIVLFATEKEQDAVACKVYVLRIIPSASLENEHVVTLRLPGDRAEMTGVYNDQGRAVAEVEFGHPASPMFAFFDIFALDRVTL